MARGLGRLRLIKSSTIFFHLFYFLIQLLTWMICPWT